MSEVYDFRFRVERKKSSLKPDQNLAIHSRGWLDARDQACDLLETLQPCNLTRRPGQCHDLLAQLHVEHHVIAPEMHESRPHRPYGGLPSWHTDLYSESLLMDSRDRGIGLSWLWVGPKF